MRVARATAALLLPALLACIQVVQRPEPEREKVPARIQAETDPELIATQVPGVMATSLDVPDVYYIEERERWYRYAWGQWFVAYSWGGHWFPFPPEQTPPELARFEPTPELKQERKLTREEKLAELERQLREIEAQEARDRGELPAAGAGERDDALERLDRELEELEEP